jgi:hypothetical protein
VHTHRIEVLDGADDDAVVARSRTTSISNSFQPSTDSSSSTSEVGEASRPRATHDLKFLAVVGDAAARAAQSERRADDHRVADLDHRSESLLQSARQARARHLKADLAHRIAKQLAVLGHVDRGARGGDELHAEFLEHALAHQIERGVERGLPAHGGQERIGTLLLNDARDGAPVDGLDVDGVGGVRIGHDGGGIGVDEHHPVALFAQRLAGLRAGVVELAGLPDDDRACADDQNAVDVGALRHGPPEALQAPQHQVIEALEEHAQIMRTGTCLRVPLKAERRMLLEGEALQGAVKERAVRGAHRFRQRRLIDGKP